MFNRQAFVTRRQPAHRSRDPRSRLCRAGFDRSWVASPELENNERGLACEFAPGQCRAGDAESGRDVAGIGQGGFRFRILKDKTRIDVAVNNAAMRRRPGVAHNRSELAMCDLKVNLEVRVPGSQQVLPGMMPNPAWGRIGQHFLRGGPAGCVGQPIAASKAADRTSPGAGAENGQPRDHRNAIAARTVAPTDQDLLEELKQKMLATFRRDRHGRMIVADAVKFLSAMMRRTSPALAGCQRGMYM